MPGENIPGFDAIGFRVSQDEGPKFTKLLKSLWAISKKYPPASGECGAVSEDYYRVWTHIDDGQISHVLESIPLMGLICEVEGYISDDLVKAWVWDAKDEESNEPLYPVCFRSPIPWFHPDASSLAKHGALSLSLTVLATRAEFFDSAEQLSEHPDLGSYADKCVVPTGMFVEGDETPSAAIMVIGHAILAVRNTNQVTDDEFVYLRVRTHGGEVNVSLPHEAVSGDPTGKIVAVLGAASGSIPDAIPQPLEPKPELNESGEPFRFDENVVEQNFIKHWNHFLTTPEFKAYFRDIHATRLERVAASVMGMANHDYVGFTKRRGKATWLTARKYKRASSRGTVVLARIVMANTMALYDGESSPALVVVAFGEGAEKAMDEARRVLARVHFGEANTQDERELAAMIEDENYHFGRRRRLPEWLVGDVEAYAADLWIPSVAAFEDGLRSEVLPCLVEPGKKGLTAPLPVSLVDQVLSESKT